jgi:hypothetical protein
MGLDFAALGTGTEIRIALELLMRADSSEPPITEEVQAAAGQIIARVEELETRLNTARRTAWVAVPVEWRTVAPGDVIVAKDGTLLQVQDGPPSTDSFDVSDGGMVRTLRSTDPERPVPVLRRPTADALDILTRQLGAQVTT